MTADLRLGRWQEALADVGEVDSLICDPPYSDRTHSGHDAAANMVNASGAWPRANGGADRRRPRREISYTHWGPDDVRDFVAAWAPRCRGWLVCLSDSDLCGVYREAYEAHRLTGFQPVAILMPGMTVRMAGDGPSSWTIYANVARPKSLSKWGTLPGGYHGSPHGRGHIGGKPLWLMRALVRDYSRPNDIVCDPCAGGGTTARACMIEGRRFVGAEMDPDTHALAMERLRGLGPSSDVQPNLFGGAAFKAGGA